MLGHLLAGGDVMAPLCRCSSPALVRMVSCVPFLLDARAKKPEKKKNSIPLLANYKTAETHEALFHVAQPLSKEMYSSSFAAKDFITSAVLGSRLALILTCLFNQVPKETSSLLQGPGQTALADIC